MYMIIDNQKNDYINQLTYFLVKNYDYIYLEKHPKFSENAKFSETDWQHLLRKIQYKVSWYNKQLAFVAPDTKESEEKCFTIEQLGRQLTTS
ncbi:hypothetical protein TEHAL1_13220 [Tetragenococcus halophilus]|uniref:hypothetical protein n=1 Tax=Tetragenococcus halophilus TaxID=51669 RepID=UPI000CCC19FC|nr:hypothetical protein [Tetragenococcus halophilus]MCO8283878.1 hypothetical protein [Tetragenococcus halophilus]GMG61115.1 hypothetical protein TEHAB4_08620 [Tetragenococcus halophilus]GMG63849.1 hypothetical protein TEHAL1_13220 [Tetragenococcus halophilus]GMG64937.1 hypothetical protein TEHIT2_01270 [Tetragenococcus halophilus]